MRRRLPIVLVLVLAAPLPAAAHGIGGRLDLGVPVSYFAAGAGLVVLVSFVLLVALWPVPRLQAGPRYRPRRAPGLATVGGVLRVLGVAGLALVVGAAITQAVRSVPAGGPTIAPVLVWVVFWLVIPFASVVVGDIYTLANPWRTIGTWARLGERERPDLARQVGVWPAVGVFLGFAWLELVWPASGSPVSLGVAALVFSAGLMAAMTAWGRETALGSVDMFTIYNRLFSAVSPLGRTQGRLAHRGWLRALVAVPPWPGLWAFVVTAIGTVSYDGLAATSSWPDLNMWGETAAMLAVVGLIAGAYLGASWTAHRITGRRTSTFAIAQRFAHTLVPIGIAYAVAHYFTLVIYEGQQLISAASDPFGLGWDLFGTAERKIDFFIRRPEPVWYFQVAVMIVGPVTGVILTHDRALGDFKGADAVRSQYAMLVLLVLLTGLGLVILAG